MRIFNGPTAEVNPVENTRFWNFKKDATNTKKASLDIYGTIVSWKSWWDNGDTVNPHDFKKELNDLGSVDEITVNINSGGGDVFAGHAIHNLLKKHEASVKVVVDGIAASAASVIAMAGDEIHVPNTSFLMIHNPSSIAWGDANEMRKTADVLDVIKEGIVAAYVNKTGKTSEEISILMDAETWMTGNKAVELGFADSTTEDDKPKNAVLNNTTLILNGVSIDTAGYKNFPRAAFENNAAPRSNEKEDNVEMEITNIQELTAQYPDLVNKIIETAVANERARLQEIETIADKIDPEIVNKAKYVEPKNAHELAFEAMKNDTKKGAEYMAKVKNDAEESKTEEVATEPTAVVEDTKKDKAEAQNAASNKMAEIGNAKKGRK